MDLITDDRLLATAVRYLIDGREDEAASILLSCSLGWEVVRSYTDFNMDKHELHVVIRGPRRAVDILSTDNPLRDSIHHAIEAVIPPDSYIQYHTVRAELVDLDPNWRTELLEIARGQGVDNQAVHAKPARVWNNLRFRSESEVRIAQALDRAGVLFLPNCKARLGSSKNRQNREADLLVCLNSKWGILEVDGEPFHPASRTTEDHERDRLFRSHGILVVEHFDATRCYEKPDEVVREFLEILKRS